MRLIKRHVLLSIGILALAAGAFLTTWLYIGGPGSTPVETWIGREIVGVLEGYITPEVAFTDLDYRRPRTLVLHNLTLTSDGRPMISVDQMQLDLAEIPREGRPIQIQRIELDNPRIYLETQADGELAGWSRFVRPEVLHNPAVVPAGRRLSDVLVLRHVQIRGGEVHYSTPDQAEPMVLPGIKLALETPPDASEPGWYRLAGTLKRDPILRADLDGRINLDTGLLELAALKLNATLGEEQYQTLPPRLQDFLRRHEVQGKMACTLRGRVPLRSPAATDGNLTASLEDVRLRIDEAGVMLAGGKLSAGLPGGPIHVEADNAWFTNAGHTLLAARHLLADLPGIPQAGKTVELTSFEADGPEAELIHDPAGGFVGWNSLGGDSNARNAAPPDPAGGQDVRPPDAPGGPETRPPESSPAATPVDALIPANQYVHIRSGEIRNGRFVYGPPGGGKPLVLNNIYVRLLQPSRKKPDWQPVSASARSDGLFRIGLTGQFNSADLVLELRQSSFRTSITGPAGYDLLPEPVGSLFRQHGLTGDMTLTFAGQIPFTRMADATGKVRMNLSRAQLHFSGVDMPIGRATISFAIPTGQVQADISQLALVGDDVSMLQIDHLRLELAEPPRKDEPLDVHTATFDRPHLKFVQAPDHGLLGWRRLVHPESSGPRLSDFVRFHEMTITGGEVLYDNNDGKGEPMVLTGIDMEFKTPPLLDTPGWYRLAGTIHREGLFDIELDGRIDPDAYQLDLNRLRFNGQLGPDQYSAFPPKVQEVLRQYELRGKLLFTAKGTVPLDHLGNTTAGIYAELTDAHMALGKTVWPVDRVEFNATLSRRTLNSRYNADLFGGTVSGNVNLMLDNPQPLRVTWDANNVRMEDTLRVAQRAEPKYSGLLSTRGSFAMKLDAGQSSLSGGGTISVVEAKLVNLPIIRAVLAVLSTATLGLVRGQQDSAAAQFQLTPDHVVVNRLNVHSDPVDLEAAGRINYDDTVNMRVSTHVARNVGRGVGNAVGRIGELGTLGLLKRLPDQMGEAFGAVGGVLGVGENIVTYRVSGPMSNPEVTINPPGQ